MSGHPRDRDVGPGRRPSDDAPTLGGVVDARRLAAVTGTALALLVVTGLLGMHALAAGHAGHLPAATGASAGGHDVGPVTDRPGGHAVDLSTDHAAATDHADGATAPTHPATVADATAELRGGGHRDAAVACLLTRGPAGPDLTPPSPVQQQPAPAASDGEHVAGPRAVAHLAVDLTRLCISRT